MLDNLPGLSVKVEPLLTGTKRAIVSGGTLFVSPAMWDLMRHASPDELDHLVRNLPTVEIPSLLCFDLPELPITCPPSFEEPFRFRTYLR